jgi:hypothetical protein
VVVAADRTRPDRALPALPWLGELGEWLWLLEVPFAEDQGPTVSGVR